MKKVIVASQNPVKQQAVLSGFQRMFGDEDFEIRGVSVPSGVSDQPMTGAETLRGALNRSKQAVEIAPDADYWVGVEGGVEAAAGDLEAFAWIVIRSRDRVGKARTGTFLLPGPVAELVRQGVELGEADDLVFNRSNSKQENGAVGLLTGNVIDRLELYAHAVVLALIPFKNEDLFPAGNG